VTGRPDVVVLPDAAAVAARAAERIAALVAERPGAVLGLATGATMLPVYARLAEIFAEGALSLGQARSFNLDEYVGLGADDPASFAAFMRENLVARTDLEPARAHLPDGTAADPEAEARRYEAAIAAAGGIDLQLLGLGRNGHVAFNEPGSDRASRTRVVALAPETRAANAAAFEGHAVPDRAITVGIATILEARSLLLVATGRAKAGALAAALDGPVGPGCPGSWLRTHPCLTVLCDRAAASALEPRTAA
jgi:glucosamine-6-phosphate deaminase